MNSHLQVRKREVLRKLTRIDRQIRMLHKEIAELEKRVDAPRTAKAAKAA